MATQNGKAVIVRGASRGIGAAIAQRLAADGFAVIVNFAGEAEAANDQVKRIRAAGAKLLRSGGRIISFSSSVIGLHQPTYGIYAATKGGVEGMTHVLANEMRGRNITVNAVAPGHTDTDLFLNGKSPQLIDRLSKLAPLEGLGRPDDVAAVVAFLAGPDGAWINGQILRANGGII
jgi:NAD(P)-dependent dehydrogenase (short-subunit alcohol dehydrogenase family)